MKGEPLRRQAAADEGAEDGIGTRHRVHGNGGGNGGADDLTARIGNARGPGIADDGDAGAVRSSSMSSSVRDFSLWRW